jgi:DNA-binding HxlR family transcriptional regulator
MPKTNATTISPAKTTRPINELLKIVGQPWTLRILWELRKSPVNFRQLRDLCDSVSPTVLNNRLRTLRDADLVELTPEGYRFTPIGLELGAKVLDLTVWARHWDDVRRSDNKSIKNID